MYGERNTLAMEEGLIPDSNGYVALPTRRRVQILEHELIHGLQGERMPIELSEYEAYLSADSFFHPCHFSDEDIQEAIFTFIALSVIWSRKHTPATDENIVPWDTLPHDASSQ
jgi:hypothetical protein